MREGYARLGSAVSAGTGRLAHFVFLSLSPLLSLACSHDSTWKFEPALNLQCPLHIHLVNPLFRDKELSKKLFAEAISLQLENSVEFLRADNAQVHQDLAKPLVFLEVLLKNRKDDG